MRNWKPGTLLIDADGSRFWVVEVTGNTIAAERTGRAWTEGASAVDADGNGWRQDSLDAARPLLVIDPEDREQVGRLLEALASMSFSTWACGADACLKAALRSLLDPEPEEPTEFGRRVIDGIGTDWVRTFNAAPNTSVRTWASGDLRSTWSDLPRPITVLSPGYTEDES